MCGIAGLISDRYDPLEPLICNMLSHIQHRGPDESGIYFDDRAAIGTARLSIIDIASGQQPMQIDGRYVMSFNGVVYNYVELRRQLQQMGESFRTESDTEVVFRSLLNWGCDAFARFDGHFAIALYDRLEEELLLARDPFGEKPLFYTSQLDYFAFGSEIKVFRGLPFFNFELDQQSLNHLAWTWATLPHQTCFKNVAALRPGHFLKLKRGEFIEQQFYTLPALNTNETNSQKFSEVEAEGELRRLMNQSVSRRLRSDLEVGSYLSGGLDSTIVSCLAHQQINDRLKTFSVSFESRGFDESEAQQQVANHLGTEHRVLRISFEDIVTNFKDVVLHAESALFRTAPVPMFLLSKFVRDSGISVVLTGEGADEFFTGYDLFKATRFRQRFEDFEDDKQRASFLANDLYSWMPHFNDAAAMKLVNYFRNYTDQSNRFFSHAMRFANGRLASQLLGPTTGFEIAGQSLQDEMTRVAGSDFATMNKMAQAQTLEIGTLMSGYLLSSQGDRMTSAHSVEGRCPFLNRELIEFAQALPASFKLDTKGLEKTILRKAFAKHIPSEIADRRKQPYRAPDAAPFANNPEIMDGLLGEELLRDTGIVDVALAKRLLAKLQRISSDQISPREDQAFIFMMSTLMLEKEFCLSSHTCSRKTLSPRTRIDGRINDDRTRKSA